MQSRQHLSADFKVLNTSVPCIGDMFHQEPNHPTFFSQVAKELGPDIMA